MGKKKKERIYSSVDQFLRLPESIVRIILSYLPFKDLVRTSILSNRWKNLWISTASSKTLIFDRNFFGREEELCWKNDNEEALYAKREYMMNLVERILCTHHNQNASLEELVLHVPSFKSKSDMQACLNRCINYAIGCNVKRLNLSDTSSPCRGGFYRLPRTIFTSKDLTSLSLHRCKLESLSSCYYSLSSLKTLSLFQVSADAQIVQNLIANCPAIEILRLSFCYDEAKGTLSISGLVNSKLVSAEIRYCQFRRVEIDVPSIESLDIGGEDSRAPCEISVSSTCCKNMKRLSLTSTAVTDKWFHDHLSNFFGLFEELEHLIIENCNMVETIKISSHRLKHLSVCRCTNLVKVEIDDPSLCSFTYAGEKVISFSSNASDLSTVDIWLHPINVDSLWYTELTKFLGKFNNSKRLNLRSGSYLNLIVPKQLKEGSWLAAPLHNVKDLVLVLDSDVSSPGVVEIIDVLLWFAPHPVTIKMSSFAKYKTWDLKFKYKEMDKDGNPCCCSSPAPIRCWRNCVENVKIKRSRGAENEWYKVFFLNTPIVEEED